MEALIWVIVGVSGIWGGYWFVKYVAADPSTITYCQAHGLPENFFAFVGYAGQVVGLVMLLYFCIKSWREWRDGAIG
jgi:hypothetical protein